ncbi:hypothetical protein sphantq_04526 (plasmid) [Sphingobium sp. AntQ-1]|nr:hypothetical protein sphantq_03530 [Sphingobium sp. AntQ-1]WCP16030.1 hypothetical protein sphantq_04526 [Sphingobium sp. AntQ-1]
MTVPTANAVGPWVYYPQVSASAGAALRCVDGSTQPLLYSQVGHFYMAQIVTSLFSENTVCKR